MSDDTSQPLQVEEVVAEPMGNSDGQSIKAVIPDTGFVPLQDFMGIAHPDDEQKDKLQHIWEYYQKGRDRAETIEEIKKSMHKLGEPPLGEDQLHRLYSYVRLQNESRSINKELRAYENAGDNKLDHTR